MSNVALSIGGRTFTVSCADGEEKHVGDLGSMIDAKVDALGDAAGQNEARMLLYAALVLADELNERRSRPAPEQEPAVPAQAVSSMLAERLTRIADKIENIAGRLEGEADNA